VIATSVFLGGVRHLQAFVWSGLPAWPPRSHIDRRETFCDLLVYPVNSASCWSRNSVIRASGWSKNV